MLVEYIDIRKELERENPTYPPETLDNLTSIAFHDKFNIPISQAIELENDKQWDRWLARHDGETKNNVMYSSPLRVKSTSEHGRYVSFGLAGSDIDQGNELIPPHVIKKVADELQGAIITMNDPSQIVDSDVAERLGKLHGGVGHEHHYISKDIVPALTVVGVKSLNGDTKLDVTAKINEDSQRADNVWNMIKNKILLGASIEYNELAKHYATIGNKFVRVIDDLAIKGLALTSKMMNKGMLINNTFVKSIADVDIQGGTKMVEEEDKKEEEEVETKEETETSELEQKEEESGKEEGSEEKNEVEELTEKVKSLTEELKKRDEEVEKVKSLTNDIAVAEKVKSFIQSEVEKLKPDITSLVEEDQEKFEKVKSAVETVSALAKEGKLDEAWEKAGEMHNELDKEGLLSTPVILT